MSNPKSTQQSIKRVALADMVAQSGYQRQTNPAQVATIVEEFDESQLGILTVSFRAGKYHIIDGAHRSHALRNLGYSHAVCVVLSGLSYEQEAELFGRQNENKRLLKPFDLFKSGLEAGDECTVQINETVRANGFKVGTGGKKNFYRITAIMALYTIVWEYGLSTLDNTLCLIANTWPGLTRATQSASLLGVAEFVRRYGLADFAERMREKCPVVWYEYGELMRNSRYSGPESSRMKFCRILVEHYNAGLGSRSKKRLAWEGR